MADEAYRIGRFLQSVYDNLVFFIPSACKSAGTLLATSANSLVIGPFGELGPLDVQLRQKDEIMGRRSGLNTRAALSDLKTHAFEAFEHFMLQIVQSSAGSISFRVAADIAAKMASDLHAKIYEQVNPDTLGQDFRDLSVATQYCERLNRRFRNTQAQAVQRLVHYYSTHDFVIDHEEAKELFSRVELPSESLYNLFAGRERDMFMPYDSGQALVEMVVLSKKGDGDATVSEDEGEVAGVANPASANGGNARRAPSAPSTPS